jgi:phosphoribosylformylglycinamidine synthase
MGLIDSEYAKILEVLGREPTITEIGMYAVMWSEHCGYKYSRPVLRLFKRYEEAMDTGAVENAGVVDLGDGVGAVMKMESHNHPSAVEPFQGAATGVGGILRDIFTMGARPIAVLDSLRFGDLSDARTRYIFNGVVEGIAHYGNCIGVPTVGGEITFHKSFTGNPLVNAMAVGIVDTRHVASAAAQGIGNPVIYVGSATGRDGIHGATFASVELGPDTESKRPNVQMGDPFQEKLLIEATLEALATGEIVGIQDMGAAGLTCSTCETAAKAGNGMTIDVRKVPAREPGMSPYEIMLSESQERMLAIAEKGAESRIVAIFNKWGLAAAVVGEVTDTGNVVVLDNGVVVADVPAKSLADDCPTYHLEAAEPAYIANLRAFDPGTLDEPADFNQVLVKLLSSLTIASKRWVYQQYDHMVQTQTTVVPGAADAAVLRLRGSSKGIALTADCNPRYCYLDPFVGAQHAVAEAARNIACVGARALAVTDCLNFANPEKPDRFWQFRRAVEGLAEACEALETPVISGNVSFYNETPESPIFPTPTIGMIGLMPDSDLAVRSAFAREDDTIWLLGAGTPTVSGSEFLSVVYDIEAGSPPDVDMHAERSLNEVIIEAAAKKLLRSAHDVSDGGLAVCLAESCISGFIGATVSLPVTALRVSNSLFGESGARVVVSVSPDNAALLKSIASEKSVPMVQIGVVGGSTLKIEQSGRILVSAPVTDLDCTYEHALPNALDPTSAQ